MSTQKEKTKSNDIEKKISEIEENLKVEQEKTSGIKITKSPIPTGYQVGITNFSTTYTQEANTADGKRDVDETLTVEILNGGVEENGWFFKMTTGENGFSFEKIDDIVKILTDFKKRFDL